MCRVFQKSGLGAKNGEQYGAPYVEEEWEEAEELAVVRTEEEGGGDGQNVEFEFDAINWNWDTFLQREDIDIDKVILINLQFSVQTLSLLLIFLKGEFPYLITSV